MTESATENTTKETTGQDANHSVAASIAKYLAKLDEANDGEKSGDTQQDDGFLASLKIHFAAMNKIHEEKIAVERKKQKDEIFYPEEDIKKQDKDNEGININI